jgi:hypothetical protein
MERNDTIQQAIERIAYWTESHPVKLNPEWGISSYEIFRSPDSEMYLLRIEFNDQGTVNALIDPGSEDATVHILTTQSNFIIGG